MKHSGPRTSPNSTEHPTSEQVTHLRDFTTTWRVMPISVLAIVIGVVAAYVAVALLKLIGFFTNLFFYFQISDSFAPPGKAVSPLGSVSFAGHHVGWLAL